MPDKYRIRAIRAANERTALIGADADLSAEEFALALAYFKGKCAYCGDREAQIIEHYVPVAQGGGTTATNCLPACHECNGHKSDISPHSAQGRLVLGDILNDRLMRYFKWIDEQQAPEPLPKPPKPPKPQRHQVRQKAWMAVAAHADMPLRFIGLRAATFALLEAEPSMSLSRLRGILACRNTIAQAFYNEWRRMHVGHSKLGERLSPKEALDIACRAMGLGLLDAKPDISQNALRKILACQHDTAAAIMTVWRNQQRNAGREDVS